MQCARSWFAVIAVMLGVSQAAHAGEDFPRIVVAVAPLAPYVSAITQNFTTAQNLLKPGQEPHDFALSPSQAAALDKADVVIIADYGMNHAFEALLRKKKKLKVIELSSLPEAKALPYAKENPWIAAIKAAPTDTYGDGTHTEKDEAHAEHHHDDHDEDAAIDPHFWLDPERMAAIAPALAEKLAEIYPNQRATFTTNATSLARHLREDVIPGMQALLTPSTMQRAQISNKPVTPFITYHAAYQYFLDRFQLNHYGEITVRPEGYRGARTMKAMLQTAKEMQVRCIIGEAASPVVKNIADLSGARIVILSPEQTIDSRTANVDWARNDYDRLLYVTAKKFGECL